MRNSRMLVRLFVTVATIGALVAVWADGRSAMADAHKGVKGAEATEWTEEKIMALTRDEVIELWRKCPAVDMDELDGEYKGLIPNAGNEAAQKATAAVMYDEDSFTGYWLGKAFKPLGPTSGDGYNRYRRPGGKIERYMRFATKMGTSLIDGKPSLMMYYGTYHLRLLPKGVENTLTDEIRKLADGVYLGMGTTKKPNGERSMPGHFVLMGPVGEWVGVDPGNEELEWAPSRESE